MSEVPGLGSTKAGRLLGGNTGFDRYFGGRRRGAKESLLGSALLVTETIFEPSILLAQAINLLLLFQTLGAVAQPMVFRVLGLRFGTALLAMLMQQHRTQLVE
jgi:hypothetical protein